MSLMIYNLHIDSSMFNDNYQCYGPFFMWMKSLVIHEPHDFMKRKENNLDFEDPRKS
jgi:hypothetical protein